MTDKEFIESSKESGRKYGYPQCCIDAFCKDTPTALKFKSSIKEKIKDTLRYKMGHLNGKFTGFIPCYEHAKQIARKKITLSSLVSKTPERTIEFPNDWSYQ
jgi:hypothetical protein